MLLPLLFGSCTAIRSFHSERMSKSGSEIRVYAISPMLSGYSLLSGLDEEQNYYSFIVKDIPHTLKIGDVYSMK